MTRQGKTVNQPTPPRTTPPPVPAPTSATKPVNTMTPAKAPPVNDEDIRARAYQKWEAAGKPVGDGTRFWLEAERELRKGK